MLRVNLPCSWKVSLQCIHSLVPSWQTCSLNCSGVWAFLISLPLHPKWACRTLQLQLGQIASNRLWNIKYCKIKQGKKGENAVLSSPLAHAPVKRVQTLQKGQWGAQPWGQGCHWRSQHSWVLPVPALPGFGWLGAAGHSSTHTQELVGMALAPSPQRQFCLTICHLGWLLCYWVHLGSHWLEVPPLVKAGWVLVCTQNKVPAVASWAGKPWDLLPPLCSKTDS